MILYYTILYYTIYYILYTIYYILYTIYYILYTIYYILYTILYDTILYHTILYLEWLSISYDYHEVQGWPRGPLDFPQPQANRSSKWVGPRNP